MKGRVWRVTIGDVSRYYECQSFPEAQRVADFAHDLFPVEKVEIVGIYEVK